MTALDTSTGFAHPLARAPRALTPVVSAALFLEAMTVSITAIAIPSMQADLGASLAVLQWTHGAFIIGFAGLLLLGGRAADLYGRRRVFLIATALFGLASLVVALAPSLGLMFAARGVQGAAAAFMIPASISILTEAYPEGPARNRALGSFNAAGAAGFSVGLVIGGVLISSLGWRWAFGLNFPAAVIIAAAGLAAIPASATEVRRDRLDAGGAASIALSVAALTLALTLAAEHGLGAAEGLLILGSALCALVFVGIERRHPAPLVPLQMFKSPGPRRYGIASLTLLGSFFGYNLLVSVALQSGLGLSADLAGLALLPMGLLCVLVAQVATPRLMDRFGTDRVGAAGLTALALAALWLFTGGASAPLWLLIGSSILAGGIGMGLSYAPLAAGAMRGVPKDRQGVAAGLQQTALQVGGVLGTAITVMAGVTAGTLEFGLWASMLIALLGAAVLLRQ
ncbi:MFS transporter [Leisingera sp. D0M16]|uniref:MFS transporter n=1 Tax=Leisingera coralii TaxID=3351347 RepID=UPI003B795F21